MRHPIMRRSRAVLLSAALIAATLIATGAGDAAAATEATHYLSLGTRSPRGVSRSGRPSAEAVSAIRTNSIGLSMRA
jgi:hypothetical protein